MKPPPSYLQSSQARTHQRRGLKIGCGVRSAMWTGIAVHMRLVIGQSASSRVTLSLAFRAASNSGIAGSHIVITTILDPLPAPDAPADERNAAEEDGTTNT